MKLEETVCSLDLSKELFKLKVPQVSLFYWDMLGDLIQYDHRDGERAYLRCYSAFTVAELGLMLSSGIVIAHKSEKPKYGEIFQQEKCPKWGKGDKRWALYLAGNEVYTFDDNEANARARFLLSLIERGIAKPGKMKKALERGR